MNLFYSFKANFLIIEYYTIKSESKLIIKNSGIIYKKIGYYIYL